ncbi:2-keto-4-pentenoate hydratase [Mycobacterium sherrisii]|uniref:2-keto-4-pentenoate hydratase n=1 Tax=Mycobacterium sherrisii TaxID=243061 RepID=A0A1E3SGG0_9MYCO|nr:fumarylacetoacetate hydrolase family protein [Mycobacterium sherrisii]MCV7030239.1 fumarylacetoacetate hydrolase family protein [Mycobacterium sherrisii]ODR00753.1 2-keto-4-pentenoate hydratase [Mycobacterium sherrisii]ORW79477.1 2-keto-4-pentenoate hydratase [Mycobacterium sherrisii]
MTSDVITAAADKLWAAQRDRVPIAPLTQLYRGVDVGTAYGVQQANLQRRLQLGATLIGHKIGLTSASMQQLLGVNEPDYGFIVDDMVISTPTVDIKWFCAPRVEPEVAFLLHKALRGPGVSAADVRKSTEAVAVALEIVDSRIADWKLTLADTVADNASSGAIVLGEWAPYTEALALPQATATLTLNGNVIESGTGDAVMGDPAAAVAWLANALAEFGTELSPGQLVMSGSFTSAAFVHAGDIATATISGLGTVSLRFT